MTQDDPPLPAQLPYGWNEMQGVNLGNLLRSEYWEFELRSFYGGN